MAMAVSNASGNSPRRPVYATAEDWKKKIKESIAGRIHNGLTVDVWIFFHPRKGDILEAAVDSLPEKRWPKGTGIIRIIYHPQSNLLTVDHAPKIYEYGEMVPLDLTRQTRVFSAEVLSLFRKINRTPL